MSTAVPTSCFWSLVDSFVMKLKLATAEVLEYVIYIVDSANNMAGKAYILSFFYPFVFYYKKKLNFRRKYVDTLECDIHNQCLHRAVQFVHVSVADDCNTWYMHCWK